MTIFEILYTKLTNIITIYFEGIKDKHTLEEAQGNMEKEAKLNYSR